MYIGIWAGMAPVIRGVTVGFFVFLPSQVYGAELYKDTVYNILTYKKRILEKPKSIKLVFGGVFS